MRKDHYTQMCKVDYVDSPLLKKMFGKYKYLPQIYFYYIIAHSEKNTLCDYLIRQGIVEKDAGDIWNTVYEKNGHGIGDCLSCHI